MVVEQSLYEWNEIMDKRLYFVLGDLASNVLAGAIIGWICGLLVGTGWNMFVAMFVMMAVGMALSLLLWLPASILFGAMEVMVPIMLTGMVSGMVVGMWGAMSPIDAGEAFRIGAISGLACIVAVWILNNQVRGLQPADKIR